jgi:hypothetical protein
MLEVRDCKTRLSPVSVPKLKNWSIQNIERRRRTFLQYCVMYKFSAVFLRLISSPPLGACSISVDTYSKLHQWSTLCLINLQNHPTLCHEISELRNMTIYLLSELGHPEVTTLRFLVTCAYCTTSLTILHIISLLKICSMCLTVEGNLIDNEHPS